MTDDIFDHPDMNDDTPSAKDLAGLVPEYDPNSNVTAADFIDTSDVPEDPTLVGGASRMTGEVIGNTRGIDPASLPANYALQPPPPPPPPVSAGAAGEEEDPLADLDDLTPEEQIRSLAAELRALRSRPVAAGGTYAGCAQCKGTGRAPFVKPGQRLGYVYHGKPVMIRCQTCFPYADVQQEVNAAIREIRAEEAVSA